MSKSINNPKENRFLLALQRELLGFFEANEGEKFSLNQILKYMNVNDRQMKLNVANQIDKMLLDKKLTKDENFLYSYDSTEIDFDGVLDHVNARFGFVRVANQDSDIYVDTKYLNGALDGDTVKVRTWENSSRKNNKEGEVIEIIERRNNEIVGNIQLTNFHGFVTPDSKKLYEDIFVPKGYQGHAVDGDKVIVKIKNWATGSKKSEGNIIEVLGKAGENNAEMHAILAEFGLPIHFPKEVETEADKIPVKITDRDIKSRKDFREITTFTIDPVDAKDFDDALSIQYFDNGLIEIGVHIADVTHYVRPNTLLEKEASMRATSVYLVDRTVPMLPEKLSNGLCSLRPNEDKLTFSAVFQLDELGNIHEQWFGRTVIHSNHRFSYEAAQEVLEGTVEGPYKKELETMNTLAKLLKAKRFEAGSINFETVEVKFVLDPSGKPLGVKPKIRKDAHKLIEEFMLLANKKVAEFVYNLKRTDPRDTMVYRVHEPPNPDKILTFAKFATRFGYKIEPNNIAKTLNSMMENVEGKPEQNIMESLAVRTMSKARYSTNPIGHFGLAFPFYSHFTSPIRRYPDMMAHRMLQHYLDGGATLPIEPNELACKHSSDREKLATEAERASIKYKQVEFMSFKDDEEFDGIVSGVTDFGIFVEITEFACEGLVRMADLTSDYFDYDADNYRIVGQRTNKTFTFGDKVRVKVKECNISRRALDFYLLDQGPNQRVKPVGHRNTKEVFGRYDKKEPKHKKKGGDNARRRR